MEPLRGRLDLTGPGCHAVVVGTGSHPGDLLHGLPAAVSSARALADALRTECGMGDRVRFLPDPQSPSEVLEALAEAADQAAPREDRAVDGIVVFCFVGHGLRGPGGRLYLATAATRSLTDTAHSVPYSEVERYLSDAAADPVVILDCCFSGNATEPSRAPVSDPFGGARPQGSYLLGSALRNTLAYAPEGAERTLFTGHLLDLLREGDAGGPRWLTLNTVYRLLDQRLQNERQRAARPYGGGTARMSELVLTANHRYASRPATEAVPPTDDDSDAVCPYPGIVPFLPEQHHLFFGREQVTRALLRRVEETRPGKPLLVIGTSGVGKSSLLRAGLSVAAEQEGLGRVRIMSGPGAQPFRELAETWAAAVDRPLADVVRDLDQGRFSRPVAGQPPRVLVIDQLEQCFTPGADATERERFAAALTAADGPRIVLVLRADYHDDALTDPHLAPVVERDHFTVPALNDAEIEQAVVGPARQVGLEWEEGVPRILRREVNEERWGGGTGDAAGLPYLAYALREIWLRRHGNTLTYAAYQDAGGIRDAVARAADQIYGGLDDEGRRRLRQMMLAMVHVADGEGRLVRRRVPPEEQDGTQDLLRRFADARLVVVDEDGWAQLGHDSLLYAWGRLSGWITEVRDDLLRLRRLTEAAEGWAAAGRTSSGLWTDAHLADAKKLTGADAGEDGEPAIPRVLVRQVVRDFVGASERAQQRARQAAERRRRRARAVFALVTAMGLIAGSLAAWAFYENGQAASRERSLIARELATRADDIRERDPLTALRLSLAAYRTAKTPETRSSLYTAATTAAPVQLLPADAHREEPVLNLAYSADGKVLAASHRRGRVRLWSLSGPRPVEAGRFKFKGSAAIAFHPRTRLLAAQSEKELTLWDTSDPRRPRRLSRLPLEQKGMTYSVAFSGDGETLAAGSAAGRLRLWNVSDPAHPALRMQRTVAEAAVISLGFTRDGDHLITGNGVGEGASKAPAQVRLWDLADPDHPVLRDTERADSVMAVAAHPRRDLVVATGGGGKSAWWRVEGGRQLRRVAASSFAGWGNALGIPSLAFSRDGKFLAGADRGQGISRVDATRKVSDLADYPPELAKLPTGEPAQSVAYSPDGRLLAAGEVGGTIRLWSSEHAWAPALPGSLPAVTEAGTSPFSADGELVITKREEPDYTTTTQVWDVGDPGGPRLRYTFPKGWEANYFLTRRHGKPMVLAHYWTKGLHNSFQLWEFDGNGPPKKGGSIPLTANVPSAVVSPDGLLLATGSREESGIALWDLRDPAKPVRRSTIGAQVKGGLFSTGDLWFAGPRSLVTIEDGEDLRFWDVSNAAHPRKGGSISEGALAKSAMYDAVSQLLVTEEAGDNIRLWDLSRPTHPDKGGSIPSAPGDFFPTGAGELATTLRDGTVEFWDVTNYKRPHRKQHDVRLDREVQSLTVTSDGRYAVTGDPYRIWSIGEDGRWRTPELVRLDDVKAVRLPPSSSPTGLRWLAVTKESPLGGDYDEEVTYVLDFDTDRLYEDMCAGNPESVPEDQWKALLPHLEYRRSCD
ncbi:AAA family ATPase [Streptomyces sp. NPDC001410]|uniref:caspase, EACC1-associated type n=1 Tax=Streptomyces sp. NPDC001410 TaxID=3364574 RepID=UPI003686596F